MKNPHPQFGLRENTASSRQHASRPTTGSSSDAICAEDEATEPKRRSSSSDDPTRALQRSVQAAPVSAATVRREISENLLLTVHEVAELLRVPVSWVYARTRRRSAERLPGYRLGKYWRFNAADVLAWVDRRRSGNR